MPSLAPPGRRTLYVETSHSRGQVSPVQDAQILAGLRQVGLIGPAEVPEIMVRTTLDCAYVLMDANYAAARQEVLAWLEQVGIASIGRYGAWTYDSMEGALAAGRDAAVRLEDGAQFANQHSGHLLRYDTVRRSPLPGARRPC